MKKIIAISLAIAAMAAWSARAADAKATFDEQCAKCHGADGKGQTKMGQKLGAKDYTDAKVQADLKDDAAFKAIKEGLKNDEGKALMKPAEGLSDDDINGARCLPAILQEVRPVRIHELFRAALPAGKPRAIRAGAFFAPG